MQNRNRKERYMLAAAAAAELLQWCPTLCNPMDCSPPGSPVPGILQARTLEWVAISFSNARKWKAKVKSLSRVWLLATPWTAAYQAPPSMGFSGQQYWSGVPLLSPYMLAESPVVPHRTPCHAASSEPIQHRLFLQQRTAESLVEKTHTCLRVQVLTGGGSHRPIRLSISHNNWNSRLQQWNQVCIISLGICAKPS